MKLFYVYIVCVILFFSCEQKHEADYPLHNKTVLILGNSITQHGLYVDFLDYYLRKNFPDKKLNIISVGLSSETVSGDSEPNHPFPRPWVHNRLDDALKLSQPDLVMACYGMNDGIYSKLDSTRFNHYKNGIKKLKHEVEQSGAELILLTPTVFDPKPIRTRISFNDSESQSYKHPYYKYNAVLQHYTNWLMSINNMKTINLHAYLNKKLIALKKQNPDGTFIPDGVHPNQIGHFYMAKKILLDLYPEIKLNTAQTELKLLQNDTLFKTISKRRQIQSEGWLNYIGYTRGRTVKSNDISTTNALVNQLDLKIQELLK
ncbi:SGNH/GDSL hydrolase family protein [Tamlana fucoidanivorans]|uniref:SGNH hydrolase-type esterase domain-containing protein n=1 Tax=Allotamlana fucoidanivorans TaxID=2583814 RepID=A0A5C4SSG9_9FLAO|nr:SGNH/GDSL hydrolase family protein [Tamlana fucoidanivorans]TNJ47068.1 hypothetical protein FGF67_00670 [Tamlana fucoidanivorans]